MNEQQLSRWTIRKKARRDQGLPAANARQLLFFVLSFHHLGQKLDSTNCLMSLMNLRTRCISEPLKATTMQKFLHIWDRNMMEPSADAVSQQQLEKLFYESVEHCQYGRCRPNCSSTKSCLRASRLKASCVEGSTKYCARRRPLSLAKRMKSTEMINFLSAPRRINSREAMQPRSKKMAQSLSPRNPPLRATRMQEVGGMGGTMQMTK